MNNSINCINVAYLFKTSVGSINGSWTEGNVSTVKKITMPDGQLLPYVSGQSLKYQIRRGWKELGLSEQLSDVVAVGSKKGVNFTEGDPEKFLDDDLLGYMIAEKGNNRRRTAPIRVAPAVGVFPFRGDRDLGTKSKEETSGSMDAGGNMFETEMYYNYFRTNFLVEFDRIGLYQPFETGQKDVVELDPKLKKERVENFFKSLSTIWGGGKQSRLLTDMSPKFVVITFQTAKNPIFLEGLTMNEQEVLDVEQVKEILEDNSSIIKHQIVGVRKGVFTNDINAELKDAVSVQTAFDQALDYIKKSL